MTGERLFGPWGPVDDGDAPTSVDEARGTASAGDVPGADGAAGEPGGEAPEARAPGSDVAAAQRSAPDDAAPVAFPPIVAGPDDDAPVVRAPVADVPVIEVLPAVVPAADAPAPGRSAPAPSNRLFESPPSDTATSDPGGGNDGTVVDDAHGDGHAEEPADRLVVTIASEPMDTESVDRDPTDAPAASAASGNGTAGGANPSVPGTDVVDAGIKAGWRTPVIAAAAGGAATGVGQLGHGRPVPDGRSAVAAQSVGTLDPSDIRRWDDAHTDVMHAVGRRPVPLADRQDVEVTAERADKSSGGRWYEVPLMLLLAFSLAFLLRTFVVQIFYVPSGSMIPTLEINDRIATEKVTLYFRDVERGDVVVFAGDEPFGADEVMSTGQRVLTGVGQFLGVVPVDAEDFVKRVIGLPGDTIEIVDGIVSVNGVELDEPYAILDSSNGVWEVPEGSLFMMGDNRPNSGDSRTSLGFIDEDEVVGRAVAKIWPLDRVGSVEGVDWDVIPDPN